MIAMAEWSSKLAKDDSVMFNLFLLFSIDNCFSFLFSCIHTKWYYISSNNKILKTDFTDINGMANLKYSESNLTTLNNILFLR